MFIGYWGKKKKEKEKRKEKKKIGDTQDAYEAIAESRTRRIIFLGNDVAIKTC